MYTSFTKLGIEGVTIKLAHRGIFNRFLENLNIKEHSVEIMRSVDKISKIGEEAVLEILSGIIDQETALKILDYIKPENTFLETLRKITDFAGGSGEDVQRLEEIYTFFTSLGVENSFVLDPSITRGLDYYTGIVYETFLDKLPEIGSVCSGGRYNNLASLYTKQNLPGVGSSIGLDRLMAALDELSDGNGKRHATDIIVTCMNVLDMKEYYRISGIFRDKGFTCEVYLSKKKLSAQFSYAEKKGIPIALLIGDDELSAGKFSVRDLSSRESFNMLSLDEAVVTCNKIIRKD